MISKHALGMVGQATALLLLLVTLPFAPASSQSKDFAKAMKDYADAKKLRALPLPVDGLQPGWVLDEGFNLRTSECWQTKPVAFRGYDFDTITGKSTSGGGFNLGLNLLGFLGLRIGAGVGKVRDVFLSFEDLKGEDVPSDGTFNWAHTDCVVSIGTRKQRLVTRVLSVGTIAATVKLDSGDSIAVDSGSLAKKGVSITFQGHFGTSLKDGMVKVGGSNLAVAVRIEEWGLKSYKCPDTPMTLGLREGFKVPQGCPQVAGDDGWYRVRILADSESLATVQYQSALAGADNEILTRQVPWGASFSAAILPRRLDQIVVAKVGKRYSLQILRSELYRSGTLGSTNMFSRAQAAEVIRFSREN